MRLHPGVKIAIGPPIADGFYYDFEFPEPISEADLEAIEDEIRREIAEGREWTREELSREEAIARFEAEAQPYKVELARDAEGAISLYTQGAFTDLCRGPHLQNAAPIKAVKLTSLAGAYWRGDEKNTQLTRIYGTAFYSQADLDAHLERLEQARARDHRRLGAQLDLFHLSDHSPGSPFWHPKGMVLWNALEDLRRRENRAPRLRRGEDAAPLRRPDLHHVGALRQLPREHVLRPAARGRGAPGAEADELPGPHAPVRVAASLLPRSPDPLRGVVDAPPRRAGRDAARAPAREAHHAGRRARLRHGGADPGRDRRDDRLRQLPLRPVRSDAAGRALDATREPARDRRAVGPRGVGARSRPEAARPRLRDLARRGNVLRPEDRPPHDRRARPELADGDDSARLPDAGAVRPHVHGRRQPRALTGRDPPRAARARSSGSSGSSSSTTAAPSRSGSRRCRRASSRSAKGIARRPARFETASPPRAIASSSTTATTRSASGSATPSSRRCRSSSSTATASRTPRSPSASGGRADDALAGRAARRASRELARRWPDSRSSADVGLLAVPSALQAGAHRFLTSRV